MSDGFSLLRWLGTCQRGLCTAFNTVAVVAKRRGEWELKHVEVIQDFTIDGQCSKMKVVFYSCMGKLPAGKCVGLRKIFSSFIFDPL